MKAKIDWLFVTVVLGGIYFLGHLFVFIGYQLADMFTRG